MELKPHTNNFDFIRFVAAASVIIGHSNFILGTSENEYFGLFLGLKNIHGNAVNIFFAISGFLITKSYIKNQNTVNYLKNRIFRIFPGLIFYCLLSYLLFGFIYAKLNFTEFLTNNLSYFKNIFLLIDDVKIDLVYQKNPDKGFINRSLWTLKYEFILYLFILILGKINFLNKKFILILFVFLLIGFFVNYFYNYDVNLFFGVNTQPLLRFSFMFFCGSIFYFYQENFILNAKTFFVPILILYFSIRFFYPASESRFFILEIILPFLVLFFCFLRLPYLNNFAKFGDFSYGIYLWGYPVQQFLCEHYGKNFFFSNIYMFSLASVFISFLFSVLSWHLIELPFIKYKRR